MVRGNGDLRMKTVRAAAVVTGAYVVGFGLPAPFVAAYLLTEGQLPTFLGLFEMYGGPWSSRVDQRTFVGLLAAFFGVTAVTGWSAWLLWRGRKAGAVLNLSLLPIEAIFWLGFALPFPWLASVARAALVAASWSSLGTRSRQLLAAQSPL
jgi:uncharacterized protein (DUF697 family)